jgi:uncharacterized protein (DUF1015 family)
LQLHRTTAEGRQRRPRGCLNRADHVAVRCTEQTVIVPRFEPFPGVRFAESIDLATVTGPPYDVLDARQRQALREGAPRHIAHIDLPEGDYRRAAATWSAWRTDGTLVTDPTPTFTRYTMTETVDGTTRSTVGLIGALELVAPGSDSVRPHERTTAKDVTDRLELTRATAANLSPVWGLSLASGLTSLIATAPVDTVQSWTDGDGVIHESAVIRDASVVEQLRARASNSPVVIADGHHRYQVSRTHALDRREAVGPGPWDLTMCLLVELAPAHLTVKPIHRLIECAGVATWDALSPWFDTHTTSIDGIEFLIGDDRRWLTPKPGAFADDVELDSMRLSDVAGHLGWTLRYHHDADRVRRTVQSGSADAGAIIRAVSVDQIIRFGAAGRLMPPKSTYFSPKPRTGVVMRSLDL